MRTVIKRSMSWLRQLDAGFLTTKTRFHMTLELALFKLLQFSSANRHCSRSQCPRGQSVVLPPLACGDCGLECRRWHGCLSVVRVVFCQVQISASVWSLVQRSPTDCGVSECDREASIVGRPWTTRSPCITENLSTLHYCFILTCHLSLSHVTALSWQDIITFPIFKLGTSSPIGDLLVTG
jgi:hypothetical protein